MSKANQWQVKIRYKRALGDTEGDTETWWTGADTAREAAANAERRAEAEKRRRDAVEARVVALVFIGTQLWHVPDGWKKNCMLEAQIRREREREAWMYA